MTVQLEAGRSVQRHVDFYNLDAIISVGYRVKSAVATRFRIWATQKLREFIVKGFVLDDERLKNPDRRLCCFLIAPNPARGCLFIATSALNLFLFVFRRRALVGVQISSRAHRAPPKNKKKD